MNAHTHVHEHTHTRAHTRRDPWRQQETDVAVSAAMGGRENLSVPKSHTRNKRQTDKKNREEEQRELGAIGYIFPPIGSLA